MISGADAEPRAASRQIGAALVASYVERLIERRCGWMATYVDLDNGNTSMCAGRTQA
jgi:hypothetical protein